MPRKSRPLGIWKKSIGLALAMAFIPKNSRKASRVFKPVFHWDARPESLHGFHERLSHFDQIYIQASYSEFIDVMPGVLGKGNAVRFLQKQLGLSHEQVVIAGDFGQRPPDVRDGIKRDHSGECA